MERMERTNHLLDRIIAVFTWNNSNDVYMHDCINMFDRNNHDHSKVLEEHNKMAEPGEDIKT